jgi:hypothetical protein
MEITEREREKLTEMKEEIRKLTIEILDIKDDPKNELEIKKRLTSILSHINTIASYSDSKNNDLDNFTDRVNRLFDLMHLERKMEIWTISPGVTETICNYANSIRFNFTKRDIRIRIPKIDLTIFRSGR